MNRTTSLSASLGAIMALASGNAMAAGNSATVEQGGVARWSDVQATECGIFGRRYAAIGGTCYFPVDMKAKPGVHEIAFWDAAGARTLGTLAVTARACAETVIGLVDEQYIRVSEGDRKRSVEERKRIASAVRGAGGEAGFAFPLGAPAEGIVRSDRSDFCELRIYNDGLVRSRHTGIDFALASGTPMLASADGTVVLAEMQFYTGNTVAVDHGGGLVTMAFHLGAIAVEKGAAVKRGDALGSVGSSGRSTGPHLHFGARYQNQRIDAGELIDDPAKLPGVGETATQPGSVVPAVDTAAPAGDGVHVVLPAEGTGAPGDATAPAVEATKHPGDPEAADIPEPQEEAIEAEAEAQRKADEAARRQ